MERSMSSSFNSNVEEATSGTSKTVDWGLIMEICDKVGKSSVYSINCLESIIKRLYAHDPQGVHQVIKILDTCLDNRRNNFLLENAIENFVQQFCKLLTKNLPYIVSDRLKSLLKKWSVNELKIEPQLNLIPSLYAKLKKEGVDFLSYTDANSSKEPNTENLETFKGVEVLSKELELELIENKHMDQRKSTIEVHCRTNLRKVKALYDFEAVEDDELSFSAGDIIYVLDSSDPNWWTGFTDKNPENLFPANFVTTDLSNAKETTKN